MRKANEKNLITGTRYMNVEGMLPFEERMARYLNDKEIEKAAPLRCLFLIISKKFLIPNKEHENGPYFSTVIFLAGFVAV